MITANRLRDGEVVWWKSGHWVERIEQGSVYEDPAAATAAHAEALTFVTSRVVVNPYLFEVRIAGSRITPASEREIIRAAGPTVRHDLGKQSCPTLESFDVSL
jgi:sulfite reductase (NADPH) hemoprotein beta-component